jgi:hypothetical protein
MKGGNYERAKMLNKTALDLERKDAKRKRTKNPDPGFKSWEDNTARQYNRLTRGKLNLPYHVCLYRYASEKKTIACENYSFTRF